ESFANQYVMIKIDENFNGGDVPLALSESIEFVKSLGAKVKERNRVSFQYAYYNGSEVALALEDETSLQTLYELARGMENGEYGKLISHVYLCILRKDFET